MRDIEVGLHRRAIDVVQEPGHARDVVQERECERLELECDLQAELRGVFAQRPHVLDGGRPLLGGRDHFLLPDVLAQDQQDVLGLEQVGHVEIGPHAVEVEPLDAGVEVDQADRHAGDAHDRQAGLRRIRP